jgi:Zn-finger in ubiquitin-hydrolases and other protein
MAEGSCAHIEAITTIKRAKHRECEECVKSGSPWVHLRTCQECGTTRCCDDSPEHHATKHARASKHPVIASAEPGEQWLYCYPHDTVTEY